MSAAGPSGRIARSVWVRGELRMMHAPAREPIGYGRCNSARLRGIADALAESMGANK